MNNLSQEKYLPTHVFDEMLRLSKLEPNIVFGGSIALNAYGLIDREVHDIDIIISNEDYIKNIKDKYEHLSVKDDEIRFYESIKSFMDKDIKHTRILTEDNEICFFRMSEQPIQYNEVTFYRDSTMSTFKMNKLSQILNAKLEYIYNSKEPRRKDFEDMRKIFGGMNKYYWEYS